MSAGGADRWKDGFGQLQIFAVFRCTCGKLAAMAEQHNGNAAMVHTTPRCQTFEQVADQQQAWKYFGAIEQLTATPELLEQLARETVSA